MAKTISRSARKKRSKGKATKATKPPKPVIDPVSPPSKPTAAITLPYADELTGAYTCRHIDMLLSYRQAKALHHVLTGLQESTARLRNGRVLQTGADVIRFIAERIETVAESTTGPA